MSSLTAKDRLSLCSFTFSDGRRCCTPLMRNHPHFCFDHAQKETRACAAESLGKDMAYFISGNYVSACDLSAALARLIPAVLRGDVKPKTAHTVAYLVQTLMQAIHLSQHEYISAFGSDGWRNSVRNSVNQNRDHIFPPASAAPTMGPLNVVAGLPTGSLPATSHSQPAPSPHTPMPPTSAEFVQHVLADLPTGSLPAILHVQPAPPAPQPAETVTNCHSERSEESAFSSSPICHAERSEASHPLPATPLAPPHQLRQARLRLPRHSPMANHLPHDPSTHASQTGTPLGSTGAPPPTSRQTANSFRINTYTPSPQPLILNHLQ